MMINLTREEAQVPLIEQLESVPEDARLRIDDVDGMGTHYFPIGNMCHEAAKVLRAKLSEPEPQPVAWLDEEFGLAYTVTELADADGTLFIPLYTSPPQREWQGLTDKEIVKVFDYIDFKNGWLMHFYRAIEAKLKEKNT